MRHWMPWIALCAGCAGAKETAIRNAMDEIWNKGDLSIVDAAYAPELAHEIKRFVTENRELYPDIKVEIVDSVIKGNRYVTRWQVTGTHRDLGAPVKLEGVSVRRREGGVFVEEALIYDLKQVYDQLGFKVVPPAGVRPFEAVAVTADVVEKADKTPVAWPADLPEGSGKEEMRAMVDKVAGVVSAKVGTVDCESYPCVAVLELPTDVKAAMSALKDHFKPEHPLPWVWPVVGAKNHLVVALPAGPLETGRQRALQQRMLAQVEAVVTPPVAPVPAPGGAAAKPK